MLFNTDFRGLVEKEVNQFCTLASYDLRGQKFGLRITNKAKIPNLKKVGWNRVLYFWPPFWPLTSEVKGPDINMFRIIMGGHLPIFVKVGWSYEALKVKLSWRTLLHCDKLSNRGATLIKTQLETVRGFFLKANFEYIRSYLI